MNKTFAVFANGGTMTTAQTALWQYDYGQILVVQGIELPTAYEVQFCNAGDSTTITSVGDSTGVVIPDQFLKNGETIYAYIYLHTGNADGETEYKITIPVMDRAKPTDIEPTPAQESTIGQLIDALNAGVEAAEEAAEKGPQIIDGYWHIWDAEAGEYVNTNVKAEGEDGEPGAPGTQIWWTTNAIAQYSETQGIVGRNRLNGVSGRTPAVDDYVFAPDLGESGDPTTLYVIAIAAANCRLTRICSIKGDDGVSPEVTITEISGGHRITITDADHPDGQSFDVMDGTGGGGTSDYNDLSNKPKINNVELSGNKSLADLGIAAASDIPTVPVQSVNNKTGAVVLGAADVGALPAAGGTMSGAIAMGSNKITGLANGTADNDAVNLSQMVSAISTNTAYFRGNFATKAALLAVAWQTTNPAGANYVTNNDFAIVQDDETQNDECWRYVYVSGTGWTAQYKVNESPLTQAQLDALNSGATASNISAISGKITAPSSATDGQFLTYDGNSGAWVATTVPSASGVSF